MSGEQKAVQGRDTEERILSSALQHFCSYGYNGTSVREITAASNVTKPTLYYYFKNKEELFSKLAAHCFQTVLGHVEERLKNQSTLQGALKSLFESMSEAFAANSEALRFIHGIIVAPQRGTPEVGAKEFSLRLNGHIHQIVDSAIARGECSEAKRHCMMLMISALLGLYFKSAITASQSHEPTASMDEVVSAVVCLAAIPQ